MFTEHVIISEGVWVSHECATCLMSNGRHLFHVRVTELDFLRYLDWDIFIGYVRHTHGSGVH